MEGESRLARHMGCSESAKGAPLDQGGPRTDSGLSATSSHVDQMISAFEQIMAQQPKATGLEGGKQDLDLSVLLCSVHAC